MIQGGHHSLSGVQTVRLGLSAAPVSLPVGCNTGLVVFESHSVWKEGSGSSKCQTGESFTEWILQENMVETSPPCRMAKHEGGNTRRRTQMAS